MTAPLLYNRLASLWPAVSPPEEYIEEVGTFLARFRRHGIADGAEILHIGSGGGSIDFHLKEHYRVTGVDISAEMIARARALNPEVEYVQEDMRAVRLNRTFDAVLVHDAIAYMTSVAELEAAYRTAAAHLRTGGLMVALPEDLRGRVPDDWASAETRMLGNQVVTVIETHYDADPEDNSAENVFVFLIREGDELRVEVDRHTVGIFELEEFLDAMRAAGFDPVAEPWELSEWEDGREMPLITAVRVE